MCSCNKNADGYNCEANYTIPEIFNMAPTVIASSTAAEPIHFQIPVYKSNTNINVTITIAGEAFGNNLDRNKTLMGIYMRFGAPVVPNLGIIFRSSSVSSVSAE